MAHGEVRSQAQETKQKEEKPREKHEKPHPLKNKYIHNYEQGENCSQKNYLIAM